jgi:hypothetical protein
MKPRLYSAPPTEHDLEVWCQVAYRFSSGDHVRWNALAHVTREAAKRDADLMLGLAQDRAHGTCYLRIGRENAQVPIVHVFVRKNPLWPSL